MAKVYVKVNAQNNIVAVDSDIYIDNLDGWVEIDEGTGDKYSLAQVKYFSKPIIDDYCVPRYKLVDGTPIERTAEEMEADRPEIPEPEEDVEDITLEMLADHEYRICLIEIEM